MATADGWAEAAVVREQMVLFPTALDDMIPAAHDPAAHGVRVLVESGCWIKLRVLDETLQTPPHAHRKVVSNGSGSR